MFRKTKSLVAIGLAILIVPLFAACSSEPEPAPTQVPVPTIAPTAVPTPTQTPEPAPNITISDAWARPAAMMMAMDDSTGSMDDSMSGMDDSMSGMHAAGATTAVYFTLINSGNASDTLIEIVDAMVETSGDLAAAVELHESRMQDGVMSMQKVSGVEIPAGESVMLKPGSYHVMILGLKRDLTPGENITLKLRFSSGDEQTIVVQVREP